MEGALGSEFWTAGVPGKVAPSSRLPASFSNRFGLYFANTRLLTVSSTSVSKATSLPSEL